MTKNIPDREKGAAQIEFLISVVTFLVLIFWTFEMCGLIYTYVVMGAAAKAGVRYAIVHGKSAGSYCSGPDCTSTADQSATNVSNLVKTYAGLSLHDTSNITVNVNYLDSSAAPPSKIQVQVAYPYIPYVSFPGFNPQLVASAEGRIVY